MQYVCQDYVSIFYCRRHVHDILGARRWSTLIAYEGRNGVQLGTLSITRYEGNTLYEHDFNGILTDLLMVRTREGRITELLYRKISADARRPVYELHCPLTTI